MSEQLSIVPTGERCRYLLSKGLFVNAGLPAGEEAAGDGNFWCGRNQSAYGPDDRLCDDENCRDSTRSCYETL